LAGRKAGAFDLKQAAGIFAPSDEASRFVNGTAIPAAAELPFHPAKGDDATRAARLIR
jgi:hypothetical protein